MIFSVVLALAFFNAKPDFRSERTILHRMVDRLRPELSACYQRFLDSDPKGLIQGPMVIQLSMTKNQENGRILNKFSSDRDFETCMLNVFQKKRVLKQVSNQFVVEIPLIFKASEMIAAAK